MSPKFVFLLNDLFLLRLKNSTFCKSLCRKMKTSKSPPQIPVFALMNHIINSAVTVYMPGEAINFQLSVNLTLRK